MRFKVAMVGLGFGAEFIHRLFKAEGAVVRIRKWFTNLSLR